MTDDRALLLAAVLDAPADDTLRLVLADKLDEIGGARNRARAELIRVQVELAVTPTFFGRGTPITQSIETDVYGSPFVDELVVGYSEGTVPNPRHAELHERQTAILKRWAASFLPKSLRSGYVGGVRVDGNVVSTYRIDARLTFERGFIARASCEIPLTPGETGPVAEMFGEHLAAIFQHNPLEGFSVSFEGHARTLHALIVPPKPSESRFPLDHWWLGWSAETGETLAPDGADSVHAGKRHEIGRRIAPWLHHAIMAPVELAQAEIDAEAADEPPAVEWLPVPAPDPLTDLNAHIEQLRAQILESLRYQGPYEPENSTMSGMRAALAAFEDDRDRYLRQFGVPGLRGALPSWLDAEARKGDL